MICSDTGFVAAVSRQTSRRGKKKKAGSSCNIRVAFIFPKCHDNPYCPSETWANLPRGIWAGLLWVLYLIICFFHRAFCEEPCSPWFHCWRHKEPCWLLTNSTPGTRPHCHRRWSKRSTGGATCCSQVERGDAKESPLIKWCLRRAKAF